jgi:hypothetical protein
MITNQSAKATTVRRVAASAHDGMISSTFGGSAG